MSQNDYERIFNICEFLSKIHKINAVLIDESGNKLYGPRENELLNFLGYANQIENILKAPENKAFIIKSNIENLMAYLTFKIEQKKLTMLLGPVYPMNISYQALNEYTDRLGYPEEYWEVILEAENLLPRYSMDEFIKIAQTAYFCLLNSVLSPDDITYKSVDETVPESINYNSIYEAVESKAYSRIHLYRDYLLECIRAGDFVRLDSGISYSYSTGSIDKFLQRGNQEAKNSFVIMITMCAISAIDGGLHREIAESIRDNYIDRMNCTSDNTQMASLLSGALGEFAKKVSNLLEASQYSYHVKKCCQYIQRHIYQQLSVQKIAESLEISQEHLSRIFKKETDKSVSEYIRAAKINESKYMMDYTTYSFSEISHMLTFSSQSHFCEVFKKEAGVTPKEYMTIKKQENWS